MRPARPEAPSVGALAAQLRLTGEAKVRYGEALRELLKLWPTHPEGFDELALCVLRACEAARERVGEPDEHKERRQSDRQVLAELPRALEAVDELRRFVRRHPEQVDWAVGCLALRLREEGIRLGPDGAQPIPGARMLGRVLEILGECLRTSLPAQRGAFLHRFQEGGLVFDRPRDQQNRGLGEPLATTLFFQLVYILRRFTAGATKRGESLYGPDPRMPAEGRPCYRLATLLTDAALGRHTEDVRSQERQLKKWLRDNPDAALGGWK